MSAMVELGIRTELQEALLEVRLISESTHTKVRLDINRPPSYMTGPSDYLTAFSH
jgi:hypothetical protein